MLICMFCALRGRVIELKVTWTRTFEWTSLDTYCVRCQHFGHYPPIPA